MASNSALPITEALQAASTPGASFFVAAEAHGKKVPAQRGIRAGQYTLKEVGA